MMILKQLANMKKLFFKGRGSKISIESAELLQEWDDKKILP